MSPADFDRFHAAVTTLSVEHDREMSAQQMEIWWAELRRYPIAAVEAALRHLLRTQRFFPKLAEILAAVEGNQKDRALAAWETVYALVKAGKSAEAASMPFDDDGIQTAVRRIGGWSRLRMMKEDEVPFRQKDFVTVYEGGGGEWVRRIGGGEGGRKGVRCLSD